MLTKVCLVKAMVFPVVMYGCELWTIKKAERWRIDAFKLWCWRSLLRVPWTARRSNWSVLQEISPEYSLEGLDVEAETPILCPPDVKGLIWKDPHAGKDWGQEEKGMTGWDGWMASPTWWTWVWASSRRVGDGQGSLACCSPGDRKKSDTTEQLNWKEYRYHLTPYDMISYDPMPRYQLKRNEEVLYPHKNLYANVYSSCIPICPKLETTWMFINWWMEQFCYIHKRVYTTQQSKEGTTATFHSMD